MQLKSVSGMVCYVKDLKKTQEFYEALGFQTRKQGEGRLTMNVNWYWIDFIPQDEESKAEFKNEAKAENKGAGIYTYLSVENVDEFYEGVKKKRLKPSSEPRDWPWGNREFVIRDPDGYKLVVFKRK